MSDNPDLPKLLRAMANGSDAKANKHDIILIAAADSIEEHEKLFDLRWKADMRAIKRWQEATGRTLVWPDHADLCVWLMEQLDQKAKP